MGYRPYAFDLRFDPVPAAEPPAPEPEADPLDLPVHSENALREAVAAAELRGLADGVERGRAEGRAEAAAAIEAEAAGVLAALGHDLREMARHLDDVTAAAEAEATAAVAAVVRRLGPGLITLEAASAVERLAVEALRVARTSPTLDIRMEPGLAGHLAPRLDELARDAGFPGRLSVMGDPGLGRGAIRAEWAAGSLSHDAAAIEAAVAVLADQALMAIRTARPVPADTTQA